MHALLLAAVAAWCFVTAVAGGLVGLVLGNIRLPALLFVAAHPAAAAGANIGVSGVAAATASVTHLRARRVDWHLVAWMVPPSVVGALAGGIAGSYVPANALRIVIGGALLVFGIDLLRPRAGAIPQARAAPNIRAAVVSGAVIGLLGGLIGLILGSLRRCCAGWASSQPARSVRTSSSGSPSEPPASSATFPVGSTGRCSPSERAPRSRVHCSGPGSRDDWRRRHCSAPSG